MKEVRFDNARRCWWSYIVARLARHGYIYGKDVFGFRGWDGADYLTMNDEKAYQLANDYLSEMEGGR